MSAPIDINSCRDCGAEFERIECELCGGDGETGPGELYDMDPLWYDPEDAEPCHQCRGRGSWLVCGARCEASEVA